LPNNRSFCNLRVSPFLIGLFLLVSAFYFYSLCPDVYLIDSGELATVSYTLGIAHPTGYPLYTLISHFFARMPGEPIRNLNLLSALFSIVASVVVFIVARRITSSQSISALVAALFAFAPTIWRISITNEVYPLTGLFAVLVITLLYQCNTERIFYMIMYSLGLALTNHIIFFSLAVPVFVYLVIVYRPRIKQISIGIILLALGLTPYLYIVARTIGGAGFAWGNAYNIQRLFWHVTGKQYQVWMFSLSLGEILNNLGNGLYILARDFLYVFLIPSVIGFSVLYRKDKKKFWLMLSILILNLLYTINYSIPDIEPYYIPSLVVLLVTFAYGMHVGRRYLRPVVVLILTLVIPFINYQTCTLRNNTFGIDFGRAHAEQLPDSSLLIATHWDIYSPLMYLQEVKGWRKDLTIIDKELLRRTWYMKRLEHEHPALCTKARNSIDAYLEELYKFEYGRPYIVSVIQLRFIKMLESLVDANIDKGVFLSAPWLDQDLDQVKPHYARLPFGLVTEVTKARAVEPFDFSKFLLKKPSPINDPRIAHNLRVVRNMLSANIKYLMATGHTEEAERVNQLLASLQ